MTHVVVPGRMPDPATPEHIGDLPPEEVTRTSLDEVGPLIFRAHSLESQIRLWKHEVEEIKARVQDILGDAAIGTIDGRPVVSFKPHFRTSFDQQEFRGDHPDLYARYLRARSVRPFRFLDETPEGEADGGH